MTSKLSTERAATSNQTDEITLSELFVLLRAKLGVIATVTVLGAVLATAASYAMKPVFRSAVVMVVVDDNNKVGGLGSLAGQLGGLASLAGANLASSGNRSELLGTLASRKLIETFIAKQNLIPILFANKWDAARGDWKKNLSKKPSLWEAADLFMGRVRSISDEKKTGLLILNVEWHDAATAAAWANGLVSLANQSLRERSIARSEKNLVYLNAQLEKSSVIEVRQAIYRLIETEFKNVMVAQGSDEYAFKVIDPAVAAEKKSAPKRILFCVGGAILGFLLGSFYALSRRGQAWIK